MKKKVTTEKKEVLDSSLNKSDLREMVRHHHTQTESDARVYRFGFWLFFILVIFSVSFSVWAISSIYSNFQTVTHILDDSFERTNLVLDITSGKITSCENEVKECQQALGQTGSSP